MVLTTYYYLLYYTLQNVFPIANGKLAMSEYRVCR